MYGRARVMFGTALACALVSCTLGAGGAFAWSPEKATYGIGEHSNVGVTMSDGTVLRVDVYYPTRGGKPATGVTVALPPFTCTRYVPSSPTSRS